MYQILNIGTKEQSSSKRIRQVLCLDVDAASTQCQKKSLSFEFSLKQA
jgi:hypothetical protein